MTARASQPAAVLNRLVTCRRLRFLPTFDVNQPGEFFNERVQNYADCDCGGERAQRRGHERRACNGGNCIRPNADSAGTYVSGDFHNHTTCSDGSISMQKLIKKATDKNDTPWGLDWFVQAGHGGNGNRNCTLAEDATLATPGVSARVRDRWHHDPGPDHQLAEHESRRSTRRAACRATRPTR